MLDPAHGGHDAAHAWFEHEGRFDWATRPITQNDVIRIIGNPRYPNSKGSPAEAALLVRSLRAFEGHRFWPDDVNIYGDEVIDPSEIRTPTQATNIYMLALAAARGGGLATFDRKPSARRVRCGRGALHLIEGMVAR